MKGEYVRTLNEEVVADSRYCTIPALVYKDSGTPTRNIS
jgi:hypothetical protein